MSHPRLSLPAVNTNLTVVALVTLKALATIAFVLCTRQNPCTLELNAMPRNKHTKIVAKNAGNRTPSSRNTLELKMGPRRA